MRRRTARLSGDLNPFHRLPVSGETRRRWRRRGLPPVPALAIKLLEGDLGEISPAWGGWLLQAGELLAPNGDRWLPGFLLAWSYERQLLQSLRRQAAEPQGRLL